MPPKAKGNAHTRATAALLQGNAERGVLDKDGVDKLSTRSFPSMGRGFQRSHSVPLGGSSEAAFAPPQPWSRHAATFHTGDDPSKATDIPKALGGITTKVRLDKPSAAQDAEFRKFVGTWLEHSKSKPYIVAFVNSRSGGQIGEAIIRRFRQLLSVDGGTGTAAGEVCDLGDAPKEPSATLYRIATSEGLIGEFNNSRIRFLVCGGDGTVTWILTEIERCEPLKGREPPVGIVPLGTGNDLARSLGWGAKLSRISDLTDYLRWAISADPVLLDQWRVTLRPHDRLTENHKLRSAGSHPRPVEVEGLGEVFVGYFQNYFSFGLDAKVTGSVEASRNTGLGRRCFQCGLGKVCYGWQGFRHGDVFKCCFAPVLTESVERIALGSGKGDMREVRIKDEVINGRKGRVRQIVMLNINSYAGGLDALKDPCLRPHDGTLELCALRNACAGALMFGGCSQMHLVGSGGEMQFELEGPQYMQMDGEPWVISAGSELNVKRHRQVIMLRAPNDSPHWYKQYNAEFWHGDAQGMSKSSASATDVVVELQHMPNQQEGA